MTSLSLDSSHAEAPDHSLPQRPGPEQLWGQRPPLLSGPQQWHQSLQQVSNRDLTGRWMKKKKHGNYFSLKAAHTEVRYCVVKCSPYPCVLPVRVSWRKLSWRPRGNHGDAPTAPAATTFLMSSRARPLQVPHLFSSARHTQVYLRLNNQYNLHID